MSTKKINVDLTVDEFAHMQAALLTHAQTLHSIDTALAEPAWSALSKIMGVPDARTVMSTRPPTRADTQMRLAECEFELIKQRVAARTRGDQ